MHSYATPPGGVQKYLGSGLIKGIGPVIAERMVAHIGMDIMHIIEDEPARLIEVYICLSGLSWSRRVGFLRVKTFRHPIHRLAALGTPALTSA